MWLDRRFETIFLNQSTVASDFIFIITVQMAFHPNRNPVPFVVVFVYLYLRQ